MKKIVMMMFAVMVLAAGSAHATVSPYSTLASWDQYGQPGNQTYTPGISTTFVTADNMERGTGLTGSAAANSFSSTGWSGSDSNDYLQFGFTVAAGYSATLSELWIGTRSSNTGPGTIGLYTSLDGYANSVFTITQQGTAFSNSIIDLSSLGSIVGTIYVRLMEVGDTQADGSGATAGTGTFRIADYSADGGITFTDTQFIGEVAAVGGHPTPIPAAAWLLGSGLLGLVGIRRRMV